MTPLQEAIQVLRTTKAKQIRNSYINFDKKDKPVGYCALGVLVCNKTKIKDRAHYNSIRAKDVLKEAGIDIFTYFDTENASEVGFLQLGKYNIFSLFDLITTANDTLKLSFKQIADLLEATFEDGII